MMSKSTKDREQQFPSKVAVRVFLDEGQHRAFSLSVSADGACLTGTEQLQEGAQVTIRYPHLSIKARVVWSTDLATGIQFLEPLASAELQKLRSIPT